MNQSKHKTPRETTPMLSPSPSRVVHSKVKRATLKHYQDAHTSPESEQHCYSTATAAWASQSSRHRPWVTSLKRPGIGFATHAGVKLTVVSTGQTPKTERAW